MLLSQNQTLLSRENEEDLVYEISACSYKKIHPYFSINIVPLFFPSKGNDAFSVKIISPKKKKTEINSPVSVHIIRVNYKLFYIIIAVTLLDSSTVRQNKSKKLGTFVELDAALARHHGAAKNLSIFQFVK